MIVSPPPLRTNDPTVFGRVAVLMGGTSTERAVSLQSGAHVLAALRARHVNAESVDGMAGLKDALATRRFDRVFNVLHGHRGGGEDGIVQGVLDAYGLPYTGSGVLGSALTMDKIRTKYVWIATGLPTPRYAVLQRDMHDDALVAAVEEIGLPIIIKPANEGSSVGVSRVTQIAELRQAVDQAFRYDTAILVEELIQGDELSVGMVGSWILPSIRIAPAGLWYDYAAKYESSDTRYVCPGLTPAEESALSALIARAFAVTGCAGWGRIDVMRDARSGAFYLLEVNTAPGMTSHSLLPKAAAQAGVCFEELVWRVLEQTL